MNMIKSTQSKYEEYEALLLERDQREKEAGQIWTRYVCEFGKLITDVFEKKIESVKRKKIIAYYQQRINRGEPVDPAAMEEYLKAEMETWYAQLKSMIEDTKRCKASKVSSAYEVKRSKELYRRIAKLLHPDMNPETDRREELMELWARTITAYHANNVKELSELEVLVRKALKDLGLGNVRVDIPDIEERIADLKKEIKEITTTQPYTFRALVESKEAREHKKRELKEELDAFTHYVKQLDEVIEELVANGGAVVKWQMN